jgi:signal transduction histidine kinase
MRQVVWNLVRNAVQASGAGATVTVEVDVQDGRVVLSVADQGPGIAPDVAERIFDAFFTTRNQGAGIGLAVVRRVIEDHARFGATIRVVGASGRAGAADAEAPRGAVFEVGLARAQPPTTEGAATKAAGGSTPDENASSHSART